MKNYEVWLGPAIALALLVGIWLWARRLERLEPEQPERRCGTSPGNAERRRVDTDDYAHHQTSVAMPAEDWAETPWPGPRASSWLADPVARKGEH